MTVEKPVNLRCTGADSPLDGCVEFPDEGAIFHSGKKRLSQVRGATRQSSCRTPPSLAVEFQPLPIELARTRGNGSGRRSSLNRPSALNLPLPQRFQHQALSAACSG